MLKICGLSICEAKKFAEKFGVFVAENVKNLIVFVRACSTSFDGEKGSF